MKTVRLIALLSAGLVLSACATSMPDGLMPADIARFEEGVAKAGCVIDNDTRASVVEKHTGFDEFKLKAITAYMLDNKSLQPEGRGIKLVTGKCADA